MKKIHYFCGLIFLCCSTTFVVGCGSQNQDPTKELTLNFVSNTLVINNTELKRGSDFKAIVSMKQQNDNYILPKGLMLYVGDDYIEASKYSFNNQTGELVIGRDLITNDLTIKGEWRVTDEGYQIRFDKDSHIHFYFYPTRNYDVEPIEDNVAVSRDMQTGKPTKDGTGEINFSYLIDENYVDSMFWKHGSTGELVGPDQTGKPGVYRLTNIKSDVDALAHTKKVYCKNLCASANYSNSEFSFSWEIEQTMIEKLEKVEIVILKNGQPQETMYASATEGFSYSNVEKEAIYHFTFTPIFKDGTRGDSVVKEMMLSQEAYDAQFPKINISTENNKIPAYDVVTHNNISTTVNTDYVQSKIQLFDDTGQQQYESSSSASDFSGSKICVRGTDSTVNSNGKESYKIQLTQEADLLSSFLGRDNVVYKHKEWLLLNCGNQLNELCGFSIEKTLGVDWVPQCQYVTLFLNNDFKGLYILCESVSKGNNNGNTYGRCPVDDTGYIIENDASYWKENISFKTQINEDTSSFEYTFKYPQESDLSIEPDQGDKFLRYDYINNFVHEFEKHFYITEHIDKYPDYVDVESFAKWTIAHDLMHVDDFMGSNMFIYKKDNSKDTKLTAGTTWDFDTAFVGNEGETGAKGLCYHRSSKIYYIKVFKEKNDFHQLAKQIFKTTQDEFIDDCITYINYITQKEDVYNALLAKEQIRFGKDQKKYDEQVKQIGHFLSIQINFMKNDNYYKI